MKMEKNILLEASISYPETEKEMDWQLGDFPVLERCESGRLALDLIIYRMVVKIMRLASMWFLQKTPKDKQKSSN